MDTKRIVPSHIAFIMDGNRRWAKKRGLPVIAGHHKGAERIEPLVEFAAKAGIRYITFWAFSSENWKRGDREVGFLMRVFREFLKSPVVGRMMKKGVRVNIIGDLDSFPDDIVAGVKKIIDMSSNNKTITATFALNYGGRAEILKAVNVIANLSLPKAKPCLPAGRNPDGIATAPPIRRRTRDDTIQIDEETFSSHLYTSELPDPDMIVRTGGEKRLSGFLPWQSVYSELLFLDTFWPDFGEKEFDLVLEEYVNRERRFGK